MGKRADFHNKLVSFVGPEWKVYFQPGETIKISYPCIVYHISGDDTLYASDKPYKSMMRYQVTFIHRNVDDDLILKVLGYFKLCSFSNHRVADNLHHDDFEIFY